MNHGQIFENEGSVGKKSLPTDKMFPNIMLRVEWDDTHETNENGAGLAFVRCKVIVKMRESPVPLEYALNISSPEFEV